MPSFNLNVADVYGMLPHILQKFVKLGEDLKAYSNRVLKTISRFHNYLASLRQVKCQGLKKSGVRICNSSRKRKTVALALVLMTFALIFLF